MNYELTPERTELLLGSEVMERMRSAKVCLFGVGGVGSWCAEALVRSGIRHLTLVDSDVVVPSNLNRQLPALVSTIGEPKVEVMRRRLLDIYPEARIDVQCRMYTPENADTFPLDDYDYIIDAIDTLECKLELIMRATRSRAKLFSSMGAALRRDITRIEVGWFEQVKGCPLARALRQRMRRRGLHPGRRFKCVFSQERGHNHPMAEASQAACSLTTGVDAEATPAMARKPKSNGTLMHIVATFGLMLSSLVIDDIEAGCKEVVKKL